ncbi:MAG: hypothetical protein JWP29_1958 [Rhodoferax sp.]|nr:hypothetical protein [Rhodoferax sp.]
MSNTALAEAFKDAGYTSANERFSRVVMNALREHPKNWDGARNALLKAVHGDAGLLWELFEPFAAQATQKALTAAAAVVRAQEMSRVRPVHAGRGHLQNANQQAVAPSRQPNTQAADGGQRQNGGGQFSGETQSHHAPSARPRSLESIAAVGVVAAQSLLDSFYANGVRLGDLTAPEAIAWSKSRERDTRFVRLLTDGLPPTGAIRKYRTAQEATELYALAEEAANA